MSTKSSEVSSGLVDYANISGVELVRLSDAEVIISAKDAEIIEQCRLNGMGAEREATLLGKVERQSAALKLARGALKFDGYPCGTGCKCIACEALAAIDALKGE